MRSRYPHQQTVSWIQVPSEICNQIYANVLEQLSCPMVKQACNYIEGYYRRSSKTPYRYPGVVFNPSIFCKRIPKFAAPEVIDELQSCRRSRSSHHAVLNFASTCRQTRRELTPLFYKTTEFHIFEEGLAFGYYEDNPFVALRAFLRSIGRVNMSSLRKVQVWHEIGPCEFPASSSLSLIHGLHSECMVYLPKAHEMNRRQSSQARKLCSSLFPSIACFSRPVIWMIYTQNPRGLTPRISKKLRLQRRWRQHILDWLLDPRPSRSGFLLHMKAWAEDQETPDRVPTFSR